MSAAAPHVMVVEDDPKIAALLADYLQAEGCRCTVQMNGNDALAALKTGGVDLLLLDLMLPGLDGLALCQAVRTFSQLPIIMLTARVDEMDRLLGLDCGADDYVCKPFSPREVMARVRAQLRRAGMPVQRRELAAFTVDHAQLRITYEGTALPLTPVEFRVLAELIAHPERVYSRQQLLDAAHGDQRDSNDRAIDSHIKNIRRKLAARLPEQDCLQSVYGVGYRFELPRSELP